MSEQAKQPVNTRHDRDNADELNTRPIMNAALTLNRKHANAAKAWRVAARVMGRTAIVLSRPMSECSRLETTICPTFGFGGYQLDCTSPGGAIDA